MKKLLWLSFGLLIGGAGGYIFGKRREHQKAVKEAEALREFYAKKEAELRKREKELNPPPPEEPEEDISKEEKKQEELTQEEIRKRYEDLLIKYDSTKTPYYKGSNAENGKEEHEMTKPPYIVDPIVAEMENGYLKQDLFYYSDDVLADANTDSLVDAMELVGYSNLDKVPSVDDAVVYVRNDKYGTQYKITRDMRSYRDATGKMPVLEDYDYDE